MHHHLPARDNSNHPLVEPGQGLLNLTYFRLLSLQADQTITVSVPGCEVACIVLAGNVDIEAGGQQFPRVGRRADIWAGPADSVYCGTDATVSLKATMNGTEVAVAGGICAKRFAPFRILPEEVSMVDVGSAETHSRRRIFHILGPNASGRTGNLKVSELYADPGCWSGYPPHKHDTERPPEETAFEEVYHYRFRPDTGFGAQFRYEESTSATGLETPRVKMVRNGDTFMVDRGYHPTVTSPGHEAYILTILVGRWQQSLMQSFEPAHQHLTSVIPGLQAMRDAFK
jgi:5-deoxy-glucuronate isomerase